MHITSLHVLFTYYEHNMYFITISVGGRSFVGVKLIYASFIFHMKYIYHYIYMLAIILNDISYIYIPIGCTYIYICCTYA